MSAAPITAPGGHRFIEVFGPKVQPSEPPSLEVLGGKGINLIALTRAGFPVPPGFVVTTAAYRHFVDTHGLAPKILAIAEKLGPHDADSLETGSAEIRAMFTDKPIPEKLAAEVTSQYQRLAAAGGERVAVRSSATAEDLPDASFAGQQDTYLNVRGVESVLKQVRACWASLWTARAMGYRAKQGIPSDQIALAVVVQQMVMAEAAGVMFTANPITGARDEIIINAAFGLGEAIVGGHVTPDQIVVDKHTGKVREITVSEKTVMTSALADGTAEKELDASRRNERVLSDAQADKLAVIGREVEAHYKSPQDMEWCLVGGEFYLVQARPITALPAEPVKSEELEKVRAEEKAAVRRLIGNRKEVIWAIHNLAETLAAPKPLTWDIVEYFMAGYGGWGKLYTDLGYYPSKRVMGAGFLYLIAGRVYADLEQSAELFFDQFPLEYDLAAVTGETNPLDQPPSKFNFERAGPSFLAKLPIHIFRIIRQGRKLKKISRRYADEFEKKILPEFVAQVNGAKLRKLSTMSDDQLLAELAVREKLLNHIGCESGKASFIAADYHARLTTTLEEIFGKAKGQELTTRLIMGLDGDMTVEQNCDLHRVALGELTLDDFIEKHGHRAAGEFELSEPRWYEDKAYLLQQVANYKKAHSGKALEPLEVHAKNKAERIEVERSLFKLLEENGAASLEGDICLDLAGTQRYMPFRETGKYYFMMAMALVRDAIVELGRRWEIGKDVFFLRRAELKEFVARRNELVAVIAQRKRRWEVLQALPMPEVIKSGDIEAIGREEEVKSSGDGVFSGTGVAAGVETGIARIVKSPNEAGDLGPNYVLVCTSTDPGWTPLFVHARGVIVERGGMLSHGAIVARDFGIPAVVLKNATKLIPDGAEIRVDGNRGRVELTSAAASSVSAKEVARV